MGRPSAPTPSPEEVDFNPQISARTLNKSFKAPIKAQDCLTHTSCVWCSWRGERSPRGKNHSTILRMKTRYLVVSMLSLRFLAKLAKVDY